MVEFKDLFCFPYCLFVVAEMDAPKTFTRPTFSASECVSLLQREWGLSAADESCLKPLPSYDDQNFALSCGSKYVLKIFHLEEKDATMELQDAVMARLREAAVTAPFARSTIRGESFVRERGHLVRLLEWVPGEDWCTMDLEHKLAAMTKVGELNGRIDAALCDVRTKGGAELRQWVWRTSDVALLAHYRWAIAKRQNKERLAIFDGLLQQFREADLENCSEGVVHNDINDHNTLHDRNTITGVIDLGDVCRERHCFSLGNTLFYMMLTLPLDRVLAAARDVTSGYQRHNKLSERELRLAWLGAKLRCLTSATMSGATQEKHPDDPYVGETEKPGWNLLDFIYNIGFYE
jgi:Ser/Thr protein kinase RdoA (MazF antagonist)